MPLTPEDFEAQRLYVQDTGIDSDTVKTFTKEHLDYLRYRGTPLEEEKQKLASERELSERKTIEPVTRNKALRNTPSIRAPIPSVPIKGLTEEKKDLQPSISKKLEDVAIAISKIPGQPIQVPLDTSIPSGEPTAEPVVEFASSDQKESADNASTGISLNLNTQEKQFLREKYPEIDFDKPSRDVEQARFDEQFARSLIAENQQKKTQNSSPINDMPTSNDAVSHRLLVSDTKKQPTIIPAAKDVREEAVLPVQSSQTVATPQDSLKQNSISQSQPSIENQQLANNTDKIATILDATTPRPPEFNEDRDAYGLAPITSQPQSTLSETIAQPSIVEIKDKKETAAQSISKDATDQSDSKNILEKEREAAVQSEQKDVADAVIEREREVAVKADEENIKNAVIERERDTATNADEEQEATAAQAREKEVIENANTENITKQLKEFNDMYGKSAAKESNSDGIGLKAAVTLIRPIADTLVSINGNLMQVLARLGDSSLTPNATPALNTQMNVPPNVPTINDGMISAARNTFRGQNSVSFSTGPRPSTPGFMEA